MRRRAGCRRRGADGGFSARGGARLRPRGKISGAGRHFEGKQPFLRVHQVYDGLFRRRTIQGQGVAAARLAAAGLRLYTEKELTEALLTALLAADQGAQARQVSWGGER